MKTDDPKISIFKRLVLTLAFSGGMAVFLNILIIVSRIIEMSEAYQKALEAYNSMPFYMLVILAVFVAPVVEELFFRGLMYGLVSHLVQKIRGVRDYRLCIALAVISSLIFGIYHGNLVQFLYAFIMGMAMCLVYEACGGLFWTITFHFFANLSSVFYGMIPGADSAVFKVSAAIISLIIAVFSGKIVYNIACTKLIKEDSPAGAQSGFGDDSDEE